MQTTPFLLLLTIVFISQLASTSPIAERVIKPRDMSSTRCGANWEDANRQCRPSCASNADCNWPHQCHSNLALAPCSGWSKSRCGLDRDDANTVDNCALACTKDSDCSWNGDSRMTCHFGLDTDVCSGENHGGWRNGYVCSLINLITGLCH